MLDERCVGRQDFWSDPLNQYTPRKNIIFEPTMEMTSATSGYVSSKSTTYDRSTNRPKSGWAEWEKAVDLDTIQSHMPDASNTSTLSLAQAVASFSRSELRWELRSEERRVGKEGGPW